MQILFVEDEVISRNTIKRKIEAAGHSIVVFDNSIDAMNYLDNAEPDVVLTDYRLGNVPDGLMLAEHVRRRYPHCVIVLISAFAGFEEAVKALQVNADDFLQKPISGYELLDRIYNAYTRRRVWLPYKDKPIEEIPDLKVDRVNRTAEWRKCPLQLTPSEFQILAKIPRHDVKVSNWLPMTGAMIGDKPCTPISREKKRARLVPEYRSRAITISDARATPYIKRSTVSMTTEGATMHGKDATT